MQHSDAIDQLAAALAKAQAVIENPARNREVKVKSDKGSYSFKYATLDAILDAVRGPLTANGLWFTQTLAETDGRYRLMTTLLHASGQWIGSETPLIVGQQSAQAFGSALSYSRRYALIALLGVASDEDDDGNAADGNHITEQRDRAPKPSPSRPRSEPPKVEPPVHPETGEIGAPHRIPVEPAKTGDGSDWVAWGGQYAAAMQAAPHLEVLEDWVRQNVVPLGECATAAPKVHNRLLQIINRERELLKQGARLAA